ncbi:MAG: response regulator [Pseudomonadota bacterium]
MEQKNLDKIYRPCYTQPESHYHVSQAKSRQVYVVDDDYDERYFISRQLRQSETVKSIFTFDGAETLFQYFDETGFYQKPRQDIQNSVILLDIHMPAINGLEILDYMRSHPKTSELDIVLLTSDESHQNIYEAYKLEATAYLQKPLCLNSFDQLMLGQNGWKS